METPSLTTARLVLRRPTYEDLESVAAYEADPIAMRFIGDGNTQDRAHAKKTLEGFIAEWERVGHGRWTVTLGSDGSVIGNCGFARWREGRQDARPELAYGFARQHWGNGYATEAARAAMSWAWMALDPPEIVALTRPANVPSQRVLLKLGFERRGEVMLPRGEMAFFARQRGQSTPEFSL